MTNRIANRAALSTAVPLLALALVFPLGGCAGLSISTRDPASITVAPHERLFLTVEPFDAVVSAELARAGLDPARVQEDVTAELRYQLALRKQEEARDSAGAAVAVTVSVRHLQPGSGNAGAFGAFALTAQRAAQRTKAPEIVEWSWSPPARDNVPEAFAARHLARLVVGEVLARLTPARARSKEPPPPLILMK